MPALLASGACGLAAPAADALQLGDIEVQSALGQPLRASIAFALAANEQLFQHCIFIRPAAGADGIPAISRATITVANGRINLLGSAPVREPLVGVGIAIDCPYTANLTRSYTVMLDPVSQQPRQPLASGPVQAAAERTDTAAAPARVQPRAARSAQPIGPASSYRVRGGDTLSDIASRIENRGVGLWEAVERLYQTNPDAFIDGDMNRLRAGATLTIPSFDGSTAARVTRPEASAAPVPAAAGEPAAEYTGYQGAGSSAAPTAAAPTAAAPTAAAVITAEQSQPAAAAAADQTLDLRPGAVSVNGNAGFIQPIEMPAGTPAEEPTTQAVSAAQPADVAPTPAEAPRSATPDTAPGRQAAATPATSTETTPTSPLLYWLGGAGLLIAGAMLFLRRRSRRQSPPPATTEIDGEAQIADTDDTARNRALPDVDIDVSELSMPATAAFLDADLSAGTGFNEGAEVEVAQDFAFSTTRDLSADLDMVLPEGAQDETEDASSTDMIPPARAEEHTILEREILPTYDRDDNEGDYDMSMIVDATQQRFDDSDVTSKELEAIAVAPTAGESDDEYTLSNEIDYQILEQDYEDELTATQALKAEMARAAIEFERRLGDDDDTARNPTLSDDQADDTKAQTVLLHVEAGAGRLAEDADDETEILCRGDLDDTGVNEELTAELPADIDDNAIEGDRTEEVPVARIESRRRDRDDDTAEITARIAAAEEQDATAEIAVESGRYKSRKLAR